MNRNARARLPVLFSTLAFAAVAAACAGITITTQPPPGPSPVPTGTTSPSRTPTPDLPATQDAERFIQTVQAYQTETAATKATERVGEDTDDQPVISPDNASQLTPAAQVLFSEIFGAKFDLNGSRAVVLLDGRTLILSTGDLSVLGEIDGEAMFTTVFPPDGEGYAAVAQGGNVVIAPGGGEETLSIPVGEERVSSMAFSPDGDRLFVATQDGLIRILNPISGEVLVQDGADTLLGVSGAADSFSFSPDGSQAAVFLYDESTLWVGDAGTLLAGAPVGTAIPWLDHAGPVASVAISPDWKHLAWVSRGTLQLMTIEGARIGEALGHEDWITNLAYLPGRDLLLISTTQSSGNGPEGLLRGYSLADGSVSLELASPEYIFELVLTRDGSMAVTGHADGTIRVWDLEAGVLVHTLAGHTGPIQGIVLSPDESLFAAIDDGPTLRIWEMESGGQVGSVETAGQFSRWIRFTPDGTGLVVISDSGEIVVYGISP